VEIPNAVAAAAAVMDSSAVDKSAKQAQEVHGRVVIATNIGGYRSDGYHAIVKTQKAKTCQT